MQTTTIDTLIIGGGASGIVAAISAGRKGKNVILCEKMPQLGKKILASGGGRCNLFNEKLDASHYNPGARELVGSIFSKFGKENIRDFFLELGLKMYAEDDRVFPIANQSSSVLKVLELELKRLKVQIELKCEIVSISFHDGYFYVIAKYNKFKCRNLIITTGGKAYPALGSDGKGYKFAEQFGHSVIESVPCAVPLVVKDELCHILQGQRILVKAKSVIDGKVKSEANGDLLFTKYGLSGTAILDISDEISAAINREHKKDVFVAVDLIPQIDEKILRDEFAKRLKKCIIEDDMLVGILPNKFSKTFGGLFKRLPIDGIISELKNRRFRVAGTKSWNEAEFTGGGVNASEVDKLTLESRLRKGLYLAGEVLDVNGKRGGYNFAWAWASGFVAGSN